MQGPVRLLAAAGGAALLLGLAFFVGYAIEQDWLVPTVRFWLGALASALLTVAAWPIARKGHDSVAGAIGGAGLGGWFAAWLVARHTHELVSAPQTFVALAAGAAACLLIADRLGLRLMAGLATLAACATPVLVASQGGRLHELMLYQLLVIAGLIVLDHRQRWPELPTLGLAATWMLAAAWASVHLQPGANAAFVAWAFVLLGASVASTWRLLVETTERSEQNHGHLRVLASGVATWIATAVAFDFQTGPFAAATAVLALWHLALGVFLRRRRSDMALGFVALGSAQVFVLGPVMFEQAMVGWWWVAMAAAATVIRWTGLGPLRTALVLIPAIAAMVWSVGSDEPWALFVGAGAGVIPLAASLWPRATEPGEGREAERPLVGLAIAATLIWAATVVSAGPPGPVAQFTWSLAPIAVLLAWACARPSPHALGVATVQFGLALLGALAAATDTHALRLDGVGNPGASLGIAVLVVLLGGLGVAAIVQFRTHQARAEQPVEAPTLILIGLMIAGALGLTLMLGVAVITGASASLGQVGYSLSVAAVGLALIVGGLRLNQASWRQTGLAALAIAASKIVLFDLASAAVGWRALSFVGLGVILIAGSFAYSQAYRRACEPVNDPPA